MRGIRLVGAVDASRADDADRRLARGHDARLHGRGVRAQNDVVVDVEGVLRVARGVVLRQVEQLEVVVVVLDLRTLDDLVAHADKDLDHALERDVHRMKRTRAALRTRQGHVNRLGVQPRAFSRAFSSSLLASRALSSAERTSLTS